MNIQDVLKDIEKLIGLELQSIRRGAEIKLEEIDWDDARIILRTKKGSKRSRPFSEIERLWRALCQHAAIHVDSELGGSGTSRNQPETILANLPYIEWLTYHNKKHIKLVSKPTHEYGTLKKMDSLASVELAQELDQVAESVPKFGAKSGIVVVSNSIRDHANLIESIIGVKGAASEQGIYTFTLSDSNLILASKEKIEGSITIGTYLILDGISSTNMKGERVKIGSTNYLLHSSDGLSMLIER